VRRLLAAAPAALVAASVLVGAATTARAQNLGHPFESQSVQIAPFAAWGFGGSVTDAATGESRSFDAAPVFGGALGLKVGEGWYVEGLFSRQSSKLGGGAASFDVALERYLLGIQEEKGDEHVRWFGTFWLGATRFVPGLSAFGSETKFTGAVGLGVKSFFNPHIGIRLEVRGFYTVVSGSGGLLCTNGDCLFAFAGSGLWQGDVGGGLVFAF
jgi:hypothetical protein